MVKEGNSIVAFFFNENTGIFIAFKQINFNQSRTQFFLYGFNDRECSRMILGIFLCVLKNSFRLN